MSTYAWRLRITLQMERKVELKQKAVEIIEFFSNEELPVPEGAGFALSRHAVTILFSPIFSRTISPVGEILNNARCFTVSSISYDF